MGRGGYARSRRPFRKSRESSHLGRGVCLIDPAVLLRIGNCVKFPVPAVIRYIVRAVECGAGGHEYGAADATVQILDEKRQLTFAIWFVPWS